MTDLRRISTNARLAVVALLLWPAMAFGGVRYAASCLERDAAMAGPALISALDGASGWVEGPYKGRKVHARVADGTVGHVGYKLFPDTMFTLMPEAPLMFVERFMLEADLPIERNVPLEKQMAWDGIETSGGSLSRLHLLAADPSVTFTLGVIDGKRYRLEWVPASGKQPFMLSFPVNYNLMRGTDRSENDLRLTEAIGRHKAVAPVKAEMPDTTRLESVGEGIYRLPGTFMQWPEKNSDRYYRKTSGDGYEPVCSDTLAEMSLGNLLTAADTPNDIQVELTLVGYDYKRKKLNLPLTVLVDYLLSTGCRPFTGLIEQTDAATTALLTMLNADEGYIHNVRVTFPTGTLTQRKGKATARLTPYIHFTKIASLYDDDNKTSANEPTKATGTRGAHPVVRYCGPLPGL